MIFVLWFSFDLYFKSIQHLCSTYVPNNAKAGTNILQICCLAGTEVNAQLLLRQTQIY